MKPIPIEEAKKLAKAYGYDQVMVYARKVDTLERSGGEHMTTYGVDKKHCDAAARIGTFLKTKIMEWCKADDSEQLLYKKLRAAAHHLICHCEPAGGRQAVKTQYVQSLERALTAADEATNDD